MSPLKYPLTITKSVYIWGQLFGAGCLGCFFGASFLGMIGIGCLGLVLHLGLVVWGQLFGVNCLFGTRGLRLAGWGWLVGVGWLRLVF